MRERAEDVIASCTDSEKLRAVLAGSNMLYFGNAAHTPFYTPAAIIHSYIQSAYRFAGGADQVAKQLVRSIRNMGGVVKRLSEVKQIHSENNTIDYVVLNNGEKVFGKQFISNIHPAITFDLLTGANIRSSYIEKFRSLKNSLSAFVVNAVMKPDSLRYFNHNLYHFSSSQVWFDENYSRANWPQAYLGFTHADEQQGEFTSNFNLMTYMSFQETKQWAQSRHTTTEGDERDSAYQEFKQQKAECLFEMVNRKFPDFSSKVQSYYVSTPLTFRDYLGSVNGSIYGIEKDAGNPYGTTLSARSKISNLYFTGQNVNLHGLLGVTISSIITCSCLLGIDYLMEKIKRA